MLLTELSIKLLKDWEINKKCIKLIKMEMLLYHKLKKEEKIKRKLKLLEKINNQTINNLKNKDNLQAKINKVNLKNKDNLNKLHKIKLQKINKNKKLINL
jgi:hypothetical protein